MENGAFYTIGKPPCGYAMHMLKQIIIGGIVGGITLFMWGFVSWVILSWHFDTVQQHDGVSAVVENVTDHVPAIWRVLLSSDDI